MYAITYTATDIRDGDRQTVTLSGLTRDGLLETVECWSSEWRGYSFGDVTVASHCHPSLLAQGVFPSVRAVAGAVADIDGMARGLSLAY